MICFKLLFPLCILCKSERSVDNPQWEMVEECLVLLTGVAWGKLIQKKPRKKPGVGTNPALIGLATIQTRHSPSPPLCDGESLLQSPAPALVTAFETFLAPCAVWLIAGAGRAHEGPCLVLLVMAHCPKVGSSWYAWILNTWKATVKLHICVFLTTHWWLSLHAYALHPGAGIKELVFLC